MATLSSLLHSPFAFSPPSLPKIESPSTSRPPPRRRNPTPPISSSLKLGVEEIALITHNKALVAAAVASAIGQLAKRSPRLFSETGSTSGRWSSREGCRLRTPLVLWLLQLLLV
ncbi:uncharacterized protein M6B38_130680 [Iris pallida]|uniref:Uncharacterized protein n=1 Tax=Iris pallida TaxID=29817 RepID=A0AAX6FZF1_IRIPA|nr:uncharacterized protein M6B38_130680 [Iris pallida]